MYYLQIRVETRRHSGWFTKELFQKVTNLHSRTASKHLQSLLKSGLVIQARDNSYRIVSQKTLIGRRGSRLTFKMSDEQIKSFSWRNIADFRAIITELEISRYKRHQKKYFKGYRKIDPRSKAVDVVKNPNRTEWDNLASLQLSSDLTGVSISTAGRYRRRQNLSHYSWKMKAVKPGKSKRGSEGSEIDTSLGGKYFIFRGNLIFSPVSKRNSSIRLSVGKR